MNNSRGIVGQMFFMWALFASSLLAATFTYVEGARTLEFFSVEFLGAPLTFGLRLDLVSNILFSMVTLLGAIVAQYSVRYLNGEKRQSYFMNNLTVCVIAVALVVLSSNLVTFSVAWILMGFGLHRLLLFYSERRPAQIAASKKFFIGRVGDVALVSAVILTFLSFGTLDFEALFNVVQADGNLGVPYYEVELIGLLFIIAAMSKSVQMPFHAWLPETMETPTPVSALMHAGIVNAGGVLIIRLSPLLQSADVAHSLLMLVGAGTAVFGSLVMITQNNIKKKLAYSTISQMGLMMFSCGLGAYSIALFHIVAHSFYKAYAFLSTGQLIDETRWDGFKIKAPSTATVMQGGLIGLAVLMLGLVWEKGQYFPYMVYASIIVLGVWQSFGEGSSLSFSRLRVFSKIVFVCTLAVVAVIALEFFLKHTMVNQLPLSPIELDHYDPKVLVAVLCYALFVVGFWVNAQLIRGKQEWARQLYIYFWNGGYFSERTTKVLRLG